ncbi:MAG: glycosyltransferase 87 family protein [Rhodothalassiaceae bacterium]
MAVFRLPVGAGLCLFVVAVALALLTPHLPNTAPLAAWPGTLFFLLMALGALAWLVLARRLLDGGQALLTAGLVLGFVLRLILLPAPAIFEDDYQRYLWDGAVTAAGLNPYTHAPADIHATAFGADYFTALTRADQAETPAIAARRALAADPAATLTQIAYPSVRTIYPPLAQAAFALAHWLEPYSLTAWRLVLLTAEIATVLLGLGVLRRAGQPGALVLLYWLHPLVLKEAVNSAHMDALLPPLLLGFVWLMSCGRRVGGGAVLAAAAAVKLWPILLLPALAAGARDRASRRQALIAAAGAGALALVMVLPQIIALSETSGLSVYARSWQTNALLFPLGVEALSLLLPDDQAGLAMRLLVALAVSGLALMLARLPDAAPETLARGCALVIAALLLLGPTAYPWYALWLMPFVLLWRHPALWLMTLVLPLYYLRFPLSEEELSALFQWLVVPAQVGPVLAGLMLWRPVRPLSVHA